MVHLKPEKEYLLHSVAINEIISGQPRAYYDWRVKEGLLAKIDFDQYYILITGLHRKTYRTFFGMEAQEYGSYFQEVQTEIESLLDAQGISYLSTMLLYDHSKKYCLIFSASPGLSSMDIAQIVSGCFNRLYARIFDMNSMPYRNYSVLSETIHGYENLTRSFHELIELSEQQFFDMQTMVMTPAMLKSSQVIPDTEKLHENQRQLRMAVRSKDLSEACQHYTSLMNQLRSARDFMLLRSELYAIREMMTGILKSCGAEFSDVGISENNITEQQYATFEQMSKQIWDNLAHCIQASQSMGALSGSMQEAVRFIRHHYADPISITDIAAYVGMSPSWLSRHFVSECRCSMTTYLQNIRIEQACILLRETDKTVSIIADTVGIGNAQYFSSVFKKIMHMTPSEYRDKNK